MKGCVTMVRVARGVIACGVLGWAVQGGAQEITIDSDRDGWSDKSERELGTDPFDSDSLPQAEEWTAEVSESSPSYWYRFEQSDPEAAIPNEGSVDTEAVYGLGVVAENLGEPSADGDLGNAVELTGPTAGANTDKLIDLAADPIPALTALRDDPLEPKTTSVEYWIKTTQSGSAGDNIAESPAVLANRDLNGDRNAHIYWGWINGEGDFGFSTSNIRELFAERDGGIEVTDGVWHHVIMIKKWRVEEPSQSKMIIDGGDLAGGATVTAETPSGEPSYQVSDTTIRFLGFQENGVGDDVQFIGQIDELAIYDRALSASEARLHFLAGTSDSDGDGMPDRWDMVHDLDPESNDADADSDGDGLSNLAEYQRGTDPQAGDTDGDGLSDLVETDTGTFKSTDDTGTSPNSADSDQDGLSDSVETGTGEFLGLEQTGTNPNGANDGDIDEDGFLDKTEISLGTSPFDSEAVPAERGRMNLLAVWEFNETSNGSEVVDQVNGLVGQFENGAALTDDSPGGESADKSLDLGEEVGTQRFHVENGGFLNVLATLDQLTVSFWQKWNTDIADTSSTAFSMRLVPSAGGDPDKGVLGHNPWGDGVIYFDTAGGSDPGQRISKPISEFENAEGPEFFQEWHHFTFVKDGPIKQVWIDGQKFLEGEDADPLLAPFDDLYIGRAGERTSINGSIDDFSVFASSLEGFQISALADGMSAQELDDLPDSDGDGLADRLEDSIGFDKDDPSDGKSDPDGDGLATAKEVQLGTDFEKADTDGDGLPDTVETDTGNFAGAKDTGTDPNHPDTDDDGLWDNVETATGEFVDADDTGSNPHQRDTDGDGFSDAAEVQLEASPVDSEQGPIAKNKANLLAMWDFNEVSNGNMVEDEVHGFVGRLEQGATLADDSPSGESGDKSLDLGQEAGPQKVRVSKAAFLQPMGDVDKMTVSFWQKWSTEIINSTTFWFVAPSVGRGASTHNPWGNGSVFFDTAGCCGPTQRISKRLPNSRALTVRPSLKSGTILHF